MIFGAITVLSVAVAAVVTVLYGSFWLTVGSFAGCFVALTLLAVLIGWVLNAYRHSCRMRLNADRNGWDRWMQ